MRIVLGKIGRFLDFSKDNFHYSLINFQFSAARRVAWSRGRVRAYNQPGTLKQQLHCKLDLTRIFGRSVTAERRGERGPPGNVGKVGVVEDIERFDPEL